MQFPKLDPKRDGRKRRGSACLVVNVYLYPFYERPAVRKKPSFLTTLPAGHDRNTFCGPPLVITALKTCFAKSPAGDGFEELIGRERKHEIRLFASRSQDDCKRLPLAVPALLH